MTAQASASLRRTSPFLQGRRRRARISLTPLIDVVFILLVFFMLASSFLDERAIKVDAPAATLGGSSMEGALLVELQSDGLRLAGQRLTGAQLFARLADHAARNPAQRVLIKPAQGVSLQDAVGLLDQVMASGLTQVSFVRDPAR
ncbi:MAG: ExbD/TolR family protein [Kiloniellaceae bacterium]